MKVQLIQPTTGEYKSNSRSGSYAPVGLLSMATYIRQEKPDIEVEILDGELLSDEEIFDRLDGDIAGITSNTVTYPQAIKVAEAAKDNGAITVLGGVYASALPERILNTRRTLFDHIVAGYGEQPMIDIIDGNADRLITNLTPAFSLIPYPDRNFINLENHVEIFQWNHPIWNYRATNIFTNVGCEWKEKTQSGCIFCSRSGMKTAFRNPQAIWQEVRELAEQYGINYVIDFSDTTLQNISWLEILIDSKPDDLNPTWHIFGRIDEIDEETITLIKKLPCKHIFTGIESGDRNTYKSIHKGGGSPEEALQKVRLLREHDISITPSYVTGLPGETEESLQRTLEHAQRVHEISDFEEIFCCQLIPFPGSAAFRMLQPELHPASDIFDIDYLKKLWAGKYCSVTYQTLEEYTHRILEMGRYTITIAKGIKAAARNKSFENQEFVQ